MAVVQMTRQEYEQKYGTKPVISVSKVNTDVAPTRMTRAEYETAYGKLPGTQTTFDKMTSGTIDTAIKKNVGGAYESIKALPGQIKTDIMQGAEGIQKNINEGTYAKAGYAPQIQTAKDIFKSSFRVSGDIANAIFAPIGAVIGTISDVTGLTKGTDYLAKKIVDASGITDQRWFQDYANTHPNAEQDVGRALVLAMSAGEQGRISPKEMVQEIKVGIQKLPETIKSYTEPLKESFAKIQENAQKAKDTKLIAEREKALYDVETNYAKTRKAIDYQKDSGAASRQRVASTDVLANSVDANGTIRTKQPGGAVEQYTKLTIDGIEDVVKKNLEREGTKVNLSEVEKYLKSAVDKSGLEGADLTAALNGIRKEIVGLAQRADVFGDIPLTKIQDAKINTTKNINYQTPPETATYRKAVARAYKTVIENKSNFDVKATNAELSKYYKDIQLLENLDGRKVKGGKLGKYFAQITGNIAGATAGGALGGLTGAAVGTVVGGEVAGALKGKMLGRTFGEATGLETPRNAILEKAKTTAELPKKVDLTKPDLKVGAKKNIPKTKEIYRLEKEISDNVEAQKRAIAAKDLQLVSKLKELYTYLVEKLKEHSRRFNRT